MTRTLRIVALAVLALPASPAIPVHASTPPVKTLDEITIEGEVRLPQVLFITSRESTRPLEYLTFYESMSAETDRGAPFPDRIGVIPPDAPADEFESPDASASPSIEPEASAPPDDPPGSPKEDHR